MTANVQTVTPQETVGRNHEGIDYGRGVRVLARRGQVLLLWVPGQSTWSGTGQPWRYSPAHMVVHRARGGRRLGTEGGQLVRAIKANAAAIDAEFGDGFHQLLEPKATVVVGQ